MDPTSSWLPRRAARTVPPTQPQAGPRRQELSKPQARGSWTEVRMLHVVRHRLPCPHRPTGHVGFTGPGRRSGWPLRGGCRVPAFGHPHPRPRRAQPGLALAATPTHSAGPGWHSRLRPRTARDLAGARGYAHAQRGPAGAHGCAHAERGTRRRARPSARPRHPIALLGPPRTPLPRVTSSLRRLSCWSGASGDMQWRLSRRRVRSAGRAFPVTAGHQAQAPRRPARGAGRVG